MANWLHIKDFKVLPWSVSGLESAIVVNRGNMEICFDIGYAHREAVKMEYVFMTHGHIDHVAGVAHHAAKRDLYNMTPPTYYAPYHLVDTLHSVGQLFGKMQERCSYLNNLNIRGIGVGDCEKLPWNRILKPFRTVHPVKSQGYLIYETVKTLKSDFRNLSYSEIREKLKNGTKVHDVITVPEVAYTGDTTIEAFLKPSNPDIFKVKLLITETTYIDSDNYSIQKASDRGHMHLQHIIDNRHLFKNVENILLVHFSDKYSKHFIESQIRQRLPSSLKHKVHLGICSIKD